MGPALLTRVLPPGEGRAQRPDGLRNQGAGLGDPHPRTCVSNLEQVIGHVGTLVFPSGELTFIGIL